MACGRHGFGYSRPCAAPLPARFFAGLIDAVPLIAAGFVIFLQVNSAGSPDAVSIRRILIVIGSGVAVYLLHTTLVEVLTGRSAGKWLLGLKVVTLEGNVPSVAQFLMRNLLRIVDPLVMILFSPLRQRDADTVANTMVIRIGAKTTGTPVEEIKESTADKTDSR